MQKYSEEFKGEMVRKMTGPGAMSAARLSKECGVGQPTLSVWLKKARLRAMRKPSMSGSAKRWTAAEKLRVVIAAAAAGDAGRGEVLRREGLFDADLERFQRDLASGGDAMGRPSQTKQSSTDKKRIKELERQVRRKDKALAEAVALAVLSKKLNAYFGEDEVGDMDEESEK